MAKVCLTEARQRSKAPKIDLDEFRRSVAYDPEAGIFTCKIPTKAVRIGTVLGTITLQGFVQLSFKGRQVAGSAAAWAIQSGNWPAFALEAANGIRSDLRWSNIRPAGLVDLDGLGRPTPDWVRSQLVYDPETGVFRWASRRPGAGLGDVAGTTTSRGYRQIALARKSYGAAVLAWVLMTDAWPVALIDHRDRNPLNNRWDNLRLATHSQNQGNKSRSSNNRSGFKGVVYIPKSAKPWRAMIGHKGKNIFLGMHDTPEQAHAAYVSAALKIHGEFFCAG